MPYTIKPGSFKYKKSNGQFSEIDCFEGPDLTEEVAALEKGKAPIIIDSAAGNPIAIKDGADGLPVEGMKIHFGPVQNLHGYDSSWPAGGGKNLLPTVLDTIKSINTNGTWNGNAYTYENVVFTVIEDNNGNITGVNVNGTANADADFYIISQYVFPAGSYTLNGCPSGGSTSTYRIFATNFGSDTGSGLSITANGTTNTSIRIQIKSGTQASNQVYKPMVRLSSVSDATFAPYSNICPIEGRTGLTAWRTGKNLLPNKKYQYTATQVRLGGENSTEVYKKLKAGTYTLSVTGNVTVQCYYTHNSVNTLLGSNGGTLIVTESDEDTSYCFYCYKSGSLSVDDILTWQLELGSTATPYTPYTGDSYHIAFPALGKNLVNQADGKTSNSNWWIGSDKVNEEPDGTFVLNAGTYTFSVSDTQNGIYIRRNGANVLNVYNNTKATFTLAEKTPVKLMLYKQGVTADYWSTINIQLETGDTTTAYEPYVSIYGGTLDTVNGVLTVEWAKNVYDGSNDESWSKHTTGSASAFAMKIPLQASWQNILSNYLNPISTSATWGNFDNWVSTLTSDLVTGIQSITTIEAWREYLAEHNLEVVYKLAAPYEIQLDPITVQTLFGNNRIWSDANGDIELDYRADTKLFCQKNDSVDDVQIDGASIISNGVANIPQASTSAYGVVKVGNGLTIESNSIRTLKATDANIKAGSDGYKPIVAYNQHKSVFYGLAKLAGANMASSSNTVGQFTDEAKSKISDMLNAPVSVSGTTPSITGQSGLHYICGEVSTLSVVAPSSGCIDVVFTSGSTPTVLTITSAKANTTIKWANGFDPTAPEANTTYEINILDGEFGVVGSWT